MDSLPLELPNEKFWDSEKKSNCYKSIWTVVANELNLAIKFVVETTLIRSSKF